MFEIASGANVTLKDLTITGGNGVANNPSGTASDDGLGGGVLNLGTLTVENSTLSGNSAQAGGGIANLSGGTFAVSDSTFSGNSAQAGGVIFNVDDTVTVNNSAPFLTTPPTVQVAASTPFTAR